MPRSLKRLKETKRRLVRKWGCDGFDWGNRCGHNPKQIREFILPEGHIPKKFFKKAYQRALRFLEHPEILRPLAYDRDLNHARLMKGERREACALTICGCFFYMDIETRALITTSNGSIENARIDQIATTAGINLGRCERALSDIDNMGLLFTKEEAVEITEGVFRGRASLKRISILLINRLGLGKDYKREVKEARKEATIAEEGKREPETYANDDEIDDAIRQRAMWRRLMKQQAGVRDPPNKSPPSQGEDFTRSSPPHFF